MSLTKSMTVKIAGFAVAAACVTGFAAVGSNATGAYFSDTKAGNVTGTIGSIQVSLSGGAGDSSNQFSFDKLMPGTPQSITVNFANTGTSPEDVYLTFPNATALSSLNNLGSYGEVHVADAGGTEIFASKNLNDRVATCGPLAPTGCWPLPDQLKVANNVAPGGTGHATFTFGYASKLGGNGGGVWNTYPVAAGQWSPTNKNGQTTVNGADGSGAGLPIAIVATQVGQTP